MTNDRADIRHSVLGVFGTTVAVGLWGFGNVLVRIIPMSGLVISFQRLWLGSATALLVMFISGRRIGWIDQFLIPPKSSCINIKIVSFD